MSFENTTQPRIYSLQQFLSFDECDHLMQEAMPRLKPSVIVDPYLPNAVKLDPRRVSQGTHFPRHFQDPILTNIDERIATLTETPVDNGEPLQILRYQAGGCFKLHHDYFLPDNGASELRRGGQRVITVILYLNTPEEGGETLFPEINLSIPPQKGDGILFYNCTPDGEVDPRTMHEGSPVIAGEKWIATKWIRESSFH
jgi:prolyl 4-hydroxylase